MIRRTRSITTLTLVVLGSLLATACRWQRTEMLVVVDSAIDWGASGTIRNMVVTVRSGGPTGAMRLDAQRFSLADGTSTLPFSFGVYAIGDDPDRVVWIEVKACGDDACTTQPPIAIQRITTRFIRGTTRTVRLEFDPRCESVPCDDPTQTCDPASQLCRSSDDGLGGASQHDAGTDGSASDAASGVIAVASGGTMTCAVRADGTTRCAGGINSFNDGFAADSRATSTITDWLGLDHVAHLALGTGHVCALRDDGTVWCRGRNDHGQLGDGTTDARDAAVRVASLEHVVALSAGVDHTCALGDDGRVWCWGRVLRAPAIAEQFADQSTPTLVEGVEHAVEIVSGDEFDCARLADRTALCWGMNERGQLGNGDTRLVGSVSGSPVQGLTDVLALAAGSRHACARVRDGSVHCWGEGGDGQRGDGTVDFTSAPTTVIGVRNAVRLAAGAGHTCARDAVGSVSCWGRNDRGQLGDGTTENRSSAVAVPLTSPAVEITAGREHTCVRDAASGVTCWGSDGNGQMSTGRPLATETASLVQTPMVNGIAAGEGISCFDTTRGFECTGLTRLGRTPRHTGLRTDGQTRVISAPAAISGIPAPAIDVANGRTSTCALLYDGSVRCWGANDSGQLGDGTTMSHSTPVSVGIPDATQVAAGIDFACALSEAGHVSCWGADDRAQLGSTPVATRCGGSPCSLVPVEVNGLDHVLQIALGAGHACAVRDDGSVRCWGDNRVAQTGAPSRSPQSSEPVTVRLPQPATAVTAGDGFSCALLADKSAWCWGSNDWGQLGRDTDPSSVCGTTRCAPLPLQVMGVHDRNGNVPIAEIRAGRRHACARTVTGSVYCWGANDYGQSAPGGSLGCPDTGACSPTAARVGAITNAAGLALGESTSCARLEGNSVWCWGEILIDRNFGYGNGSQPMLVPELSGATSLSGGYRNMCGRISGRMNCWGDNIAGQTGTGIPSNPRAPVRFPSLGTVVGASSGFGHTCALIDDGSVTCSGRNWVGELGDGTHVTHARPNPASDLSNATAISSNGVHTCAIRDDGTLACWGCASLNRVGRDFNNVDAVAPETVPIGGHVTHVSASGAHSCAITDGGAVVCWGANDYGQLGQGTTGEPLNPVAVPFATGVADVAASQVGTCMVRDDGTVGCWGGSPFGQAGNGSSGFAFFYNPVDVTLPGPTPQRVIAVPGTLRAGWTHVCVETPAGDHVCWGDNREGQLGNGVANHQYFPSLVAIAGLREVTPLGGGVGGHTCAIRTADETVVCWGANEMGQLGDGTFRSRLAPAPVIGLHDVVHLYGGPGHACALERDGSLWCWGRNPYGELGTDAGMAQPIPTPVRDLGEVRDVGAGFGYACVLVDDGTVRCLGSNGAGQLGAGAEGFGDSDSPITVFGLQGASGLSVGSAHACAIIGDEIASERTVSCWGRADSGQLGIAMQTPWRPFALGVPGLRAASALAAGGRHTCAIENQSIRCWGANDRGQLGTTTTTSCPRLGPTARPTSESIPCSGPPLQVSLPSSADGVAEIASGGLHTCARTTSGAVYCWGANTRGQLGSGETTDHATAVRVGLPDGAVATSISASHRVRCSYDSSFLFDCEPSGEDHTCAVLADHSMWCWGANDRGQLGDGSRVDRTAPVRATVTDVTSVRAGGAHTCVLGNSGRVSCFGDDAEGQLGLGSMVSVTVPRAIAF